MAKAVPPAHGATQPVCLLGLLTFHIAPGYLREMFVRRTVRGAIPDDCANHSFSSGLRSSTLIRSSETTICATRALTTACFLLESALPSLRTSRSAFRKQSASIFAAGFARSRASRSDTSKPVILLSSSAT
jgi:hypothetical protein